MMPLKVLMLGWELPPFNSGGLGEACLGLAKALSRKGVQITFVLPRKVDVKISDFDVVFANIDEDIVNIKSAYTHSNPYWSLSFNIEDLPPDYIRAALKYAEMMGKVLMKVDPDIIHAHDWMTYPAGVVSKAKTKRPLVAHVHSTEFDRSGGQNPNRAVFEIEKAGLTVADRVLPVGGFMKDVLVKSYGVSPEKIKVVYNGVNQEISRFFPPALKAYKDMGYKIVLYLGRITLQKGPEYFVRAAKKVSDYYPKVLFVVTGSGDMQDYMIFEAARLGVLNKFLFTGFLRGEEKDKVYQAADLYVMPSVSEPFGITALEAIVNGTPVLISKQSGVSEVLSHALKTDFWDIDEMANKILSVLRYKALPKDLKKESKKEVKNLSWDRAADSVLEVYRQLI